MFDSLDDYDVQATRKEAREEAIKEVTEKFEVKEKKYEDEIKKLQERIRELENIRS